VEFPAQGLSNGHAHRLAAHPVVMARRATTRDIPFLLDLAEESYRRALDRPGMATWLTQAIHHPNYLVLMTDHAALVAMADPPAYDPGRPEARVLYFLGRRVWEVIRLLRIAGVWAHTIGAPGIRIEATNGLDIAPLAKRLGARLDPQPAYFLKV